MLVVPGCGKGQRMETSARDSSMHGVWGTSLGGGTNSPLHRVFSPEPRGMSVNVRVALLFFGKPTFIKHITGMTTNYNIILDAFCMVLNNTRTLTNPPSHSYLCYFSKNIGGVGFSMAQSYSNFRTLGGGGDAVGTRDTTTSPFDWNPTDTGEIWTTSQLLEFGELFQVVFRRNGCSSAPSTFKTEMVGHATPPVLWQVDDDGGCKPG